MLSFKMHRSAKKCVFTFTHTHTSCHIRIICCCLFDQSYTEHQKCLRTAKINTSYAVDKIDKIKTIKINAV